MDEYSLDLAEVKVKIGGKPYTLREASAGGARVYKNARMERMSFSTDGTITGIKGIGDLEAILVSVCLFDEANKPVPLGLIHSWPDRVVQPLAKTARTISGFDDEETVEALVKQRDALTKRIELLQEKGSAVKNESSATETSST